MTERQGNFLFTFGNSVPGKEWMINESQTAGSYGSTYIQQNITQL